MLEGYVDQSLQPIVEIGLVADSVTIAPVVVDTGFTGFVGLSMRSFGDVRLRFLESREFELANGDVVAEDVFEGEIEFDGERMFAEFILSDNPDTLIGSALLHDRTLYIDYPVKTVRIA